MSTRSRVEVFHALKVGFQLSSTCTSLFPLNPRWDITEMVVWYSVGYLVKWTSILHYVGCIGLFCSMNKGFIYVGPILGWCSSSPFVSRPSSIMAPNWKLCSMFENLGAHPSASLSLIDEVQKVYVAKSCFFKNLSLNLLSLHSHLLIVKEFVF